MIAGTQNDRQGSSKENEAKTVLCLKEEIEDIEGLEKQPAPGEEDDGEGQPVTRIDQKNQRDEREVTEERDDQFQEEGAAHRRTVAAIHFDKMPNENSVESESRDDGEDADKGESESERAKTLRTKMPAERDCDDREGADARALVQERPRTVREQSPTDRSHATAGVRRAMESCCSSFCTAATR